ncbi:flavin-containing monooxygenase [Aspergillus homomorphus CBS 101889]|uniref:FAD/NAD(P)-binding domain-containing protein n=1 Tax=Aspergillus homomorphus (strain CBS 101889) TaxID=1450537 RepID=A0A395I4R9_ASPHC|nr:FAD/NAD(P)-binding domain-containing protein [Aspergillus homomorphus CBS 101889]RAL15191.1 FAD/NAD(P)-binding domain-containing protein [Aspergillus homomorphus CBS 101889]
MHSRPIHANRQLRVICIGAGASGLYLAYRLKKSFTDFTLQIYEKNADVGGTWFENRYPGCACDIPAHNYTYTFEPNPAWSANYATASEIAAYFAGFADKYGLREYIACQHEVVHAEWDEDRAEWMVRVRRSADGTVLEQRCDFLINAAGILNAWKYPDIPGLDTFEGTLVHTAHWDETLDVGGKRVGLIGNGSSGVQVLPELQRKAQHVTAFIRSATWVSPARGMEYHQYTEEEKRNFRENPDQLLAVRKQTEGFMTSAALFSMFIQGSKAQEVLAQDMETQMRAKLGSDHVLAKSIIPDFPLGCRRPTPGINYLESLGQPNVTACPGPIKEVTRTGCIAADGSAHELDVLVCATGFDTTFRPRFPVLGREARDLATQWADEPRNYLSLAARHFPNYFMFVGPNCPIGSGPIMVCIEAAGDYMARMLNRWQKEGIRSFEPKAAAVDDFMTYKDRFMASTVWHARAGSGRCRSWWRDSRSGQVTALWPGSTVHYLEALATPRYDDYDVDYVGGNRFDYLGNGFAQRQLAANADPVWYLRTADEGELLPDLMSTENAKDLGSLLRDGFEWTPAQGA